MQDSEIGEIGSRPHFAKASWGKGDKGNREERGNSLVKWELVEFFPGFFAKDSDFVFGEDV